MSDGGLHDAEHYVSYDPTTGTLSVEHAAMVADVTGTEADAWKEAEGPESGCGENYYLQHDDDMRNARDARINVDQGFLTISIVDEDGDEIGEASLDLNDSPTWASNGGSDDGSDDDGDDEDGSDHD